MSDSTYYAELTRAMGVLAEHPRTIFAGQAVCYPGTAMFRTLERVPMKRRREWPVAEDAQLGWCIGMAMQGWIPVCIYPRINFLLLAMGQLVLGLDKLPIYGNGFKPKVIIRTAIATDQPLNPGPQHLGDFTTDIAGMTKTVSFHRIGVAEHIVPTYERVLTDDCSSVVVELMEHY